MERAKSTQDSLHDQPVQEAILANNTPGSADELNGKWVFKQQRPVVEQVRGPHRSHEFGRPTWFPFLHLTSCARVGSDRCRWHLTHQAQASLYRRPRRRLLSASPELIPACLVFLLPRRPLRHFPGNCPGGTDDLLLRRRLPLFHVCGHINGGVAQQLLGTPKHRTSLRGSL